MANLPRSRISAPTRLIRCTKNRSAASVTCAISASPPTIRSKTPRVCRF